MKALRTRGVYLAFLLCPVLLMIGACPLSIDPVGSLRIALGSDLNPARTIAPALPMEIASYTIGGTGPAGASFYESQYTGTSYTASSLPIGSWTVTADGYNSEGTRIATDQKSVTISAGQTTNVTMTVVPLAGSGTLSLSVSWTSGSLASPSMVATLTPVGGSASNLSFSLGSDSATYSGQWSAGYYELNMQLRDGSVPKWGKVEAARILAGQTSSASYTYTQSGTGEISVTIDSDLNNPFSIALDGNTDSLLQGQSMTVTATCSETPDTYQWYLNGTAISGATSSSVTVGADLSPGAYSLDVLAAKGTRRSSAGAFFYVQSSGQVTLDIHMRTEAYGSECSWDIRDSSEAVVASGSGYASYTDYYAEATVVPGTYTLNGYDSYGDSWHGGWMSITQADGTVLVSYFTVGGSYNSVSFTVGGGGAGFSENFDDGAADNWLADSSYQWSVTGGTLQMTAAYADAWRYAFYNADFSDFTYTVDVINTGTYLSSARGIHIRSSDGDACNNNYAFTISGDGSYWVGVYTGGSYTWTEWISSSAINTGQGAVNTLKVVASGASMAFFINNQLTYTLVDSSYSTGKVGVFAYDGDYYATVSFDNISLVPGGSSSMSFLFATNQRALVKGTSEDQTAESTR